jgi:hypothetical protein
MEAMEDLAVVVQTCDQYNDLWEPFYTLYDRYWPDCPFGIYHVTESRPFRRGKVNTILTGQDKEWSERLLFALDRIETRYILLLLDDYFLLKKVSNKKMTECVAILNKNPKSAYLRIFPVPGPDEDHLSDSKIGIVRKDSPYSISTQATIWRKEILRSLLLPGESVWDFELKGSKRGIHVDSDFLSLKIAHRNKAETGDYPFTYLCTAVYKGKWMREAIALCRREKIPLDLLYRKEESRYERFYRLKYNKMPTPVKHVIDFIRHRFLSS